MGHHLKNSSRGLCRGVFWEFLRGIMGVQTLAHLGCSSYGYMGDGQNYGPFLGPYYNTGPNLGDPKRDHNFDNPPYSKHWAFIIAVT